MVAMSNGQTGCAWAGRTTRSSHPMMVLKWTTSGGRGRPREEVEQGAFFGGWGSKWEPAVAVAAPMRGKEEGRKRQGKTREGWGNASVRLSAGPRADKRDAREGARAIWADAFRGQMRPKMGVRGRVRTMLSAWSSHWVEYFVRADVFEHVVSI
jgi:hypothetical protein